MAQDFLSDVELYYSEKVNNGKVEISDEEFHHIKDVMRHEIGDEIYLTDGKGAIYQSIIQAVDQKKINCKILSSKHYENKFSNITFCLPRLRNTDRFEFALEKFVELGITNFIVFDSTRTVAKGEKIERWQKVILSAMKQSLRAWLPKVSYVKSISEIYKLDGTKILFDQNASQTFQQFLATNHQSLNTNHFFLFGPEGGFSQEESRVMSGERRVKLTDNRLRSETAIVTAASILTTTL